MKQLTAADLIIGNKQTAMMELLTWIRKTLPMDLDTPQMIESRIEQAIAMEREQIEEAFDKGDCNGTFETINRKQYYSKTFKK